MQNIVEVGVLPANPKNISPTMKLGQSFVVMPCGLAVEGQPSLDDWLETGKLLYKAEGSLRWWRGDWLNYGELIFRETYREATETTGLNINTLRNEKYVAKQVNLSLRSDKLSWKHHEVVAPLPPDQQQYWLNYAEEHELKASELRDKIKGAQKFTWLRYTDVWNFSECDKRFGADFPGRIPGQIIQNILYYYTKEDDFVVDPMGGGGTTFDVCTKSDDFKRECIAFDIKPSRKDITEADATKDWPVDKKADLVFIDPPYWSQQDKAYGGMASESYNEFILKIRRVIQQSNKYLNPKGILSIIISPMAIKTEYIDLPFVLYEISREYGFKLKRRIHVAVGSQQVGPAVQKYHKDNHSMVALARDLLILENSF